MGEGAFNAFDDLIEDDASENVTVVHQHSNEDPLEIENVDLLQWIVNDQAIAVQEDMTENAAVQKMITKTEVERVSVIVPVTSLSPPVPVSEVKIELLSGMRSIARCECRTTRPASGAEPIGSGNTW